MNNNIFLASLLMVLISGCTLVPEPIQVNNKQSLASFSDVIDNQNTTGKPLVRWGGKLVELDSSEEGNSLIIEQRALRIHGRPNGLNTAANGQFIARISKEFDIEHYYHKHDYTFIGRLVEQSELTSSEKKQRLPVIEVDSLYFWGDNLSSVGHVNVKAEPKWTDRIYLSTVCYRYTGCETQVKDFRY